MSLSGTTLTSWQRASMTALSSTSDIDLFGYSKRVVDFDAEVAYRALDLGVAQEQLHRPQIAGGFVDD